MLICNDGRTEFRRVKIVRIEADVLHLAHLDYGCYSKLRIEDQLHQLKPLHPESRLAKRHGYARKLGLASFQNVARFTAAQLKLFANLITKQTENGQNTLFLKTDSDHKTSQQFAWVELFCRNETGEHVSLADLFIKECGMSGNLNEELESFKELLVESGIRKFNPGLGGVGRGTPRHGGGPNGSPPEVSWYTACSAAASNTSSFSTPVEHNARPLFQWDERGQMQVAERLNGSIIGNST